MGIGPMEQWMDGYGFDTLPMCFLNMVCLLLQLITIPLQKIFKIKKIFALPKWEQWEASVWTKDIIRAIIIVWGVLVIKVVPYALQKCGDYNYNHGWISSWLKFYLWALLRLPSLQSWVILHANFSFDFFRIIFSEGWTPSEDRIIV